MNAHAADRVKRADAAFFRALLDQDLELLGALLADDFLIVDVGSGTVHRRAEFLAAVEYSLVVFRAIDVDPSETLVRRYGSVAIVLGRTRMTIAGPDTSAAEVASRYTHVFAADGDEWRLVSAQGTAINE